MFSILWKEKRSSAFKKLKVMISSIRYQLAIVLSLFSLLTITSLVVLFIKMDEVQLHKQQDISVRERVEGYRNAAGHQLSRFDYNSTEELIKLIKKAPNIIAVQITNEFGQEVGRAPEILPNENTKKIELNLMSGNGNSIGVIRVWWDYFNHMNDIKGEYILRTLILCFTVLLILSFFIYHYLSYSIVTPLQVLQSRISELGDSPINNKIIVPNEIKMLQQQYFEMKRHVSQQLHELEQAARKSQRIYEESPALLLIVDSNGIIIQTSNYLANFFLMSRESLIGLSFVKFVAKEYHVTWMLILKSFSEGQDVQSELLELQLGKGERKRVYFSSVVEGSLNYFIAFLDDITEEHRVHSHLQLIAKVDSLTGLLSRLEIEKRILDFLYLAERKNISFAIMFLDLDNFKKINDVYGHAAGDKVIKFVANALKQILPNYCEIGRFGGDEFIILIKDSALMDGIIHDIYTAMQQDFTLDNREIYIAASIGVAAYPKDGETVDVLLSNADLALYQAKRQGRNQACIFAKDLEDEANYWLAAGDALRKALKCNSFTYYCQPIVDKYNNIKWCELLLRLEKPDSEEVLLPSNFLNVAEDIGLMGNIAKFMMEFIFDEFDSSPNKVGITLNLSRSQLLMPNLIDLLKPIRRWSDYIVIEVTEEAFLGGGDARVILKSIRELGFTIALDDFGSGYSSLAILKDLPFDIVKLDKEFQRNIQQRGDARAIISSITSMLHVLGKKVVAEGIETKEQYLIAMDAGCDYFQGYYFSKPFKASLNTILHE